MLNLRLLGAQVRLAAARRIHKNLLTARRNLYRAAIVGDVAGVIAASKSIQRWDRLGYRLGADMHPASPLVSAASIHAAASTAAMVCRRHAGHNGATSSVGRHAEGVQ